MFSPAYRWPDFCEHCHALSDRTKRSGHVVVTDIAQFFNTLTPTALSNAVPLELSQNVYLQQAVRICNELNYPNNFGLPVGNNCARLLSEMILIPVDNFLQSFTGCTVARYSDDIRVFCPDRSTALDLLGRLADFIFTSLGLTLAEAKTKVVSAEEYRAGFDRAAERVEAESLSERFEDILREVGRASSYDEALDYDSLPPEAKEKIAVLNLDSLLGEELDKERPDPILTRFLLQRLAELPATDLVSRVCDAFERLWPVSDGVARFLHGQAQRLGEEDRFAIGRRVLEALDSESASTYARICLLSIFAQPPGCNSADRLEQLYSNNADPDVRREIILALGQMKRSGWPEQEFNRLADLGPWLRRAVLDASSRCTPANAQQRRLASLAGQLDPLEAAVSLTALDEQGALEL